MPRSVASVFGNPEDFRAALSKEGVLSLLVVGQGQFCARLTQVELNHLRVAAGEEQLSRIAFVTVPADTVLVSLPIGDRPAPIWGGIGMQAREMITLAPGQRVYARTDAPCRWGSIGLPGEELARYGRAVSGADLALPSVARWRPPRAALRELRHFHRAAIRAAEMRSRALADNQAADGLKQQLIHALVECLSTGSVNEETEAACGRRGILARFEDLLQKRPAPDIAQICAALGVSEGTLRQCCEEHLGMGTSEYCSLRGVGSV